MPSMRILVQQTRTVPKGKAVYFAYGFAGMRCTTYQQERRRLRRLTLLEQLL